MNPWDDFNPNGYTWKDTFPGVYTIENSTNNRLYIGSSICVRSRLINHLWYLRRGDHANRDLQKEFNEFGEKAFRIGVWEMANSLEQARHQEQWLLDMCFKAKSNLYNRARKVEYYDGDDRKKTIRLLSPDGNVMEFRGIKDFCRQYGQDRSCIGRVLKDPKFTCKGWKNVNYKSKEDQILALIDPTGQRVDVKRGDLDEFCQKHNLKRQNITNLFSGWSDSYIGWTRADKPQLRTVRDPEGNLHHIGPFMGRAFAKARGFGHNFDGMLSGRRPTYRGWTLVSQPIAEPLAIYPIP